MSTNKVMTKKIVNGVEITEDDDGTTHFRAIMDQPKKEEPKRDDRSWWDKLCDWWNESPVTPYVKVRDMSDPLNQFENEDHGIEQTGVEAGIKIKF